MNIEIGDKKVGFVFQGDELIYPAYIKDGLVLHYDFSGMGNNDVTRGVARDLSGNGNDGLLQNFAYDAGSGYEDNGLEFDGVDDLIMSNEIINLNKECTISTCFLANFENPAECLISNLNTSENTGINVSYFRTGSFRVSYGNGVSVSNHITIPVGTLINRVKYEISVSVNANQVNIYLNGEIVSSTTEGNVMLGESIFIIGDRYTSLTEVRYPLSGTLFSSQVFDSALTPQEIAHNYKIDKHRFNIQD